MMEGKSQNDLANESGCSECFIQAYSEKVEWNEKVGGKGAQATGITAASRGLSSKGHSILWELHKEWTEAGVSALRVTMQRHPGNGLQLSLCQATRVKPVLMSSHSLLALSDNVRSVLIITGLSVTQSPKSSIQTKVNFAFNLKSKVPES